MDTYTKRSHSFTKFHTLQEKLTDDGQKYYFSINLKKWGLFLASSAIITLGFTLGLIILFPIHFNNIPLQSYFLYVIRGWGVGLLVALCMLSLVYTVYLIVTVPRMIKLQKFTLTLKEGEVSVCGKSLTIPENLAMRIIVRSRYNVREDLNTTLQFETLGSPFFQLSRFEKYLSYHEKRRLAEQLSLNLKIQLTDMLSSFEPGIYENEQNFSEKLKLTKLEPSGTLKLATSKNVQNIQLPYEKRVILEKVGFAIITLLLLSFSLLPSSTAARLATSFDYLFLGIIAVILTSAVHLPIILRTQIRSKIVVSDDSISLIRKNIWGTRRVFHSNFNELKDISIIPTTTKSSRMVFRSDKLTKMTARNSKEAVTNAVMTINNLLVN